MLMKLKLKLWIKKYGWIIPALILIPILYLVYRYLKTRDQTHKEVEELFKR